MKQNFLNLSFSTLRGRLTLWYILSTFFIFAILASLFSSLLWDSLNSQIDHHVYIVTEQARQIADDFQGEERKKLLTNLVNFEGMTIAIISEDGKPILETHSEDLSSLSSDKLIQIEETAKKDGYHPLHFTIDDMRFGAVEITDGTKSALLVVGYSVNILRQSFFQMMNILFIVMLSTILPFAIIGHSLLKKYLYPLEVVAKTASKVTAPKQLSLRITGLALTDELKTIVASFNNMLSQLENIFQTEHDFFSQAAHTLKTPLAVLRSKVEGSDKESQTNKKIMLKTIDNAVDAIQDLLLISRIETGLVGEQKRVSLSEVALELVEIAESLALEKQVKITSDIKTELYLETDPRLLRRALGNIVHNALDYVNQNGKVKITLEDNFNFTVENTGKIIQKKDMPNIFDRFYRGENAKENKGSGLGLAISKAIVESFNGSIRVESKNGKTKFIVVFKK